MGLEDLQFRRVETWDDACDFMSWLGESRPWLGCDTETSGLLLGDDQIRLVQFGDARMGWALDYPEWKGLVADVFRNYDGRCVWHNALFDLKMLKFDGVQTKQRFQHDTMVSCFLKDPGSRIDLKGAASLYVDSRARAGQSVLKDFMAAGGFSWGTVPREAGPYWVYGVLDTCLTAMLAESLWSDTGGGPLREAYELNMAVIHILRDAEITGLRVDEPYRAAAEAKLREELGGLEAEIPFTPSKDRQALEYLLSVGAEITERTDTGNLSVDKHVLGRLMREDPDRFRVAGLLNTWRQKARNLRTYIETMADVSRGGMTVDGVLRAHAHPVGGIDDSGKNRGTRTGRLSVTDPALQTLPKGRIVRDAIIAREGCHILQADYAGMELRALASMAGEVGMLDAFERGEDLHEFVASKIFGPGFTKPQRGIAKNASFCKAYGGGPAKIAETAGVPLSEAETFVAMYEETFPALTSFMQGVVNDIMNQAGGRRGRGWVTLPDGTRLPVQGDEAYKGVNYKIQGGTAVVAKRKLVELDAAGLGEFFRLAVHDEFLFEVPDAEIREAREILHHVMPDKTTYPGVVLEIESDVVYRWGAHFRGDDYPPYVETVDPEWIDE
jgi:DNA polymerase I